MNYVELNGVKSNTIKGLMIQALPPISKPLMRTEIEQIDGRDGDIVTNLGYAAYDREMTIGLYAGYDIDAIISYFDSSGTVVFSDEPDKYYNYQIYQQIDFEKLLRFRTANVVFHVQPFKYSAVGDDVYYSAEKYQGLPNTTITKNGVTVAANDGEITISGTASAYAEIYLPINPITLNPGSYTLNLTADGTGAAACPTRLIGSVPSNADSFSGNYVSLNDDATVTATDTLTAAETYNYLWFYISPNTAIDLTLSVNLFGESADSVNLVNMGNVNAKPTVTVTGSGTVVLEVNGNEVLTLSLGESEQITIDAAAMNAYSGDVLMNRAVTGDYAALALVPGANVLSWSGSVTSIEVTKISRWI